MNIPDFIELLCLDVVQSRLAGHSEKRLQKEAAIVYISLTMVYAILSARPEAVIYTGLSKCSLYPEDPKQVMQTDGKVISVYPWTKKLNNHHIIAVTVNITMQAYADNKRYTPKSSFAVELPDRAFVHIIL